MWYLEIVAGQDLCYLDHKGTLRHGTPFFQGPYRARLYNTARGANQAHRFVLRDPDVREIITRRVPQ